MTTKRLANAHAALVMLDLHNRFGPVVPIGFPITARFTGHCSRGTCGQSIRPGDRIVSAVRLDKCGKKIQDSLWVHHHCPELHDTVEWLRRREFDVIEDVFPGCSPQNCKRCGHKQEGVNIYRVIDYPSHYFIYVCEECVRL